MLYLLCFAIIAMLFAGPFAYSKTLGSKRRKIEKYEKKTGTKLSAKEKVHMMK